MGGACTRDALRFTERFLTENASEEKLAAMRAAIGFARQLEFAKAPIKDIAFDVGEGELCAFDPIATVLHSVAVKGTFEGLARGESGKANSVNEKSFEFAPNVSGKSAVRFDKRGDAPFDEIELRFWEREKPNLTIIIAYNRIGAALFPTKKAILRGDRIYDFASVFADSQTNSAVCRDCCVCFERRVDTLALPCRHAALCAECARRVRSGDGKCVVCRQSARWFLRLCAD